MVLLSFLIKRLLQGGVVLLAVVVLLSGLLFSAPIDPAQLTFGQRLDEEAIAAKRVELGLDQSVFTRIYRYVDDLLPIDIGSGSDARGVSFGTSYQTGVEVGALLAEAIPSTVVLALAALLLAIAIGIPLGVAAAARKGRWLDSCIVVLSTIGISVPSYVSSIVLALIFGYLLGGLTGLPIQGGWFAIDDMGNEYLAWSHLVLPAIALGIRPVAVITQLTRSTMIDVLSSDFVKTAKSKGLAIKSIMWRHAFPNSLNPVITSVTGYLASLLAGAFFVERVFSFRGVGDLTISALLNYDIPVVLGCALFISAVFVVINMIADVLYLITSPNSSLT
jgi:peptide/nickel transport system permease protein